MAKVLPLFKGGDYLDRNCYRPISLLPSIGKLLEKVISTRSLKYFNSLNLFSDCQFGFREKYTTEFAILDIYEKLLKNVDERKITCTIFWILPRRSTR